MTGQGEVLCMPIICQASVVCLQICHGGVACVHVCMVYVRVSMYVGASVYV